MSASRAFADVIDVNALSHEARIARASSFIEGRGGIFSYKRRNSVEMNHFFDQIKACLAGMDRDALKMVIAGLPKLCAERELTIQDVEYAWNQIVSHAHLEYPESMADASFDFTDFEQIVTQFKTLASFCRYMESQLTWLIESRPKAAMAAAPAGGAQRTDNAQMNKLIAYIDAHYTDEIILRDLARMFYLNANYCCSLFKKHLGATFSEYVNSLRIEKSKSMLLETDGKISDIAQAVGYNDYFYFNRVFKKLTGATPSKFRRGQNR
ncbi:MAG: helix-turn-helix domain-containing protein [Clostridiales bacterium]|jgi:YesN/AraC family two-component response regulator|nr:helix-turn-helix domain-containing protein [Clostridiales bacterium]